MMKTKTVGKRKQPQTPAEFYALGAQLDREMKALAPCRSRGFVVKFRTWDDLESWERTRTKRTAAGEAAAKKVRDMTCRLSLPG